MSQINLTLDGGDPSQINDIINNIVSSTIPAGASAQSQNSQPQQAPSHNAQHPNLVSLNQQDNMQEIDPLIGPSGPQAQAQPRPQANPLSNVVTQVLNISNNFNIGAAHGGQQAMGGQGPMVFTGPGFAGGFLNLGQPNDAAGGGGAGFGGVLNNIAAFMNGAEAQQQASQLNQALQQSFNDFMNQANGAQGNPACETFVANLRVIKGCDIVEVKECQICIERFGEDDDVHKLPCKHLFHKDCIGPWFKDHDTCPVCRQVMPREDR